MDIKEKTLRLIDELKSTCAAYGMGNDGNEYKIITQVFLYKFLNDKFGYEIKNAKSDISKKIKSAEKWETAYSELSDEERFLLQGAISADVPVLEPCHLISSLWNQQSKGDFDVIFDSTMTDIAEQEVKEAEAEAKIAIAKAQGEAEALKIQGDGEAYYNRVVAASLNGLIVQQYAIEKWNGELPTYNGSNALPFINLSK